MRRRLFGLVVAAVAAWPAAAAAAPVVVLGPGGHARVRNDPYLTAVSLTPPPSTVSMPAAASGASAGPTVLGELARLRRIGAITAAAYRSYTASFNAALGAERGLRATRASELEGVLENLHAIAAAGLLTATRLPALFETLDRNRQWWTSGPLLSSGQRVEFAGSELVWEYYPGQGIELQVLGTFGKADGLYTAGRADYPGLRRLLSEMIPLAVDRDGGLVWEYYFQFDGGDPPWTSAMSQGTGLEALTRAFEAFHDRSYLAVAHRALPIFTVPPPAGVREGTPAGARYLQYSFAPGAWIINAFLQSLIGLYDYAEVSHDRLAARLFAAGDAEARIEVPQYDTGAWSLYQPGVEDTLDYHELVTGFLQELCARTHAAVYCGTAARFGRYLKTPPVLTMLTHRVPAGSSGTIHFRLSKYSHVGIVLVQGTRTVFLTSAYFSYGVNAFAIPPLHAGQYQIRLAATDLAGNFSRILGTIAAS